MARAVPNPMPAVAAFFEPVFALLPMCCLHRGPVPGESGQGGETTLVQKSCPAIHLSAVRSIC
jgi:hypothetical protein